MLVFLARVCTKCVNVYLRSGCYTQVRTLEQALQKDFDPDRRLHGWAREGMSMDRDDFIDLAHVSKEVPGKTSAQVSGVH